MTMTGINLPSIQSLLIEMRFESQALSTGTAFAVQARSGPHLITNRHNVTGRHQETNEPLSPTSGVPNQLVVFHNRFNHLGQWVPRSEALYAGELPLWKEHPVLGPRADFVALPLSNLEDVALYPYDATNTGPPIYVGPSDPVSVVGFPFGLTGGGVYAIWATGFIASEPDVNYGELPVVLIDCRSRPGQSGSPVVAHRSGGSYAMIDGGTSMFGASVSKFVGIYSGRINSESDLGIVWKASAIAELIDTL